MSSFGTSAQDLPKWAGEKKLLNPIVLVGSAGTHRSQEKPYNKGLIRIDEDNNIPCRNHPSICFPISSIDQLGCFWRMFGCIVQNHPFKLPPCRTMVQDITSGCSCQTKAFCKSISVMRHCLPSPASPGRQDDGNFSALIWETPWNLNHSWDRYLAMATNLGSKGTTKLTNWSYI